MIQFPFFNALNKKVILVLSAHCDDAAIGCGGLLLRLLEYKNTNNIRLVSIVFSGGNNEKRTEEEKNASKDFGLEVNNIFSFTDTRLPDVWYEIKNILFDIGNMLGFDNIGMVVCPNIHDLHQDHRTIAENVWHVFRNHFIVEYEIQKYEGGLIQPNFYVKLTEDQAIKKAKLIMKNYPSRSCHHWFNIETFLSLMRIRGIEANTKFAEGFTVRKIIV
jgi:LmbE family N-acetylglucosaminyl deacetylase